MAQRVVLLSRGGQLGHQCGPRLLAGVGAGCGVDGAGDRDPLGHEEPDGSLGIAHRGELEVDHDQRSAVVAGHHVGVVPHRVAVARSVDRVPETSLRFGGV